MTTPSDEREQARLLMHAAIDGELDPVNAIAVEQRIAADPALANERAGVEALRRALREQLPIEPVPPGLQQRIRQAVGLMAERSRPTRPTWMAMAASVALAIIASSSATWYALRPLTTPGESITEALVDDHVRALMAPRPTDVSSSDQHTVKPWFAGRITQAPRVVDLAKDGFPLVGGRVDVIGRAAVPTLVYSRRQHLISLTAIPGAAGTQSAPTVRTKQGYNLISWTADGVSYWAVSDLNPSELETFARLFREAPS
jgi:anti-sigma factor RsiW